MVIEIPARTMGTPARIKVLAMRLGCAFAMLLLASGIAAAQGGVAGTVHNFAAGKLSPSAQGRTAGVCVFCHTPHNARPTRALWNRELPGVTYKLYESSTMLAKTNQPNGSSRLCLSCHDGIMAMSNVRKAPRGVTVASLPRLTGKASLGTDLSDDHPISFTYDPNLALRKGNLADPASLPRTAPLDDTNQMQCTSCHDPHESGRPNFLRLDNQFGAACTVCHRDRDWTNSSHATSTMTWHGASNDAPWPSGGYPTMGENGCESCHRVHSAPHPQRLLAQTMEVKNCTICHNSTLPGENLEAEFFKPSRHPIEAREWTHDPAEDPFRMPRHVTCVDCHNPHAATKTVGASGPLIPGSLRGVSGVTISGTPIKEAQYEYEICLKCHGTDEPTSIATVRQDPSRNIRVKIGPNSRSSHPLTAPSPSLGIAAFRSGLVPPLNPSSVITCTDCHNSDQWTKGSKVPRGPHGSRFAPILAAEYETIDPSPESYASYALCYKCHDRNALLFGNLMNGFPHKQHVIDNRTSCAVCHDAHGSRENPHTINFMIMSGQGAPVVRPAKNGRLEYVPDLARPGHGKCYMTCHGTEHNGTAY